MFERTAMLACLRRTAVRQGARSSARASASASAMPKYEAAVFDMSGEEEKAGGGVRSVFRTPLDIEIDDFEGALPKPERCAKRRFEAVVQSVWKKARVFEALEGPATRFRVELTSLGDDTMESQTVFMDLQDESAAPKTGDYVMALVDGRNLVSAMPLSGDSLVKHKMSEELRATLIRAFLMSETSHNMTVGERAAMLSWTQDFIRDGQREETA